MTSPNVADQPPDSPSYDGEKLLASARVVSEMELRLRRAGIGVRLRRSQGRYTAHGVNIDLGAGAPSETGLVAALAEAGACAGSASMHLGGPVDRTVAERVLAAAAQAGLQRHSVTLSVDPIGGTQPEAVAWLLSGCGPFRAGYVFADSAESAGAWAPDARGHGHRSSRPAPGLHTAWHSCVRSACPLLPAQSTRTLVADIGLAAPARTAWLPLTLDVSRYARADGAIDACTLGKGLDTCVESGDRIIDHLHWSCPVQREDARLNRRLAIHLTGVGDLVSLRRLDPSSLSCLRELDALVNGIHEGLWRRSGELAALLGAAPALLELQPSADWRDEAHRRDWACRWREAVARSQVRHRNLLVLSPWSVIPSSRNADARYADLLPLLAHADAICFAGEPCLGHWPPADRRRFHRRLSAQIERFNATSFVAAGA